MVYGLWFGVQGLVFRLTTCPPCSILPRALNVTLRLDGVPLTINLTIDGVRTGETGSVATRSGPPPNRIDPPPKPAEPSGVSPEPCCRTRTAWGPGDRKGREEDDEEEEEADGPTPGLDGPASGRRGRDGWWEKGGAWGSVVGLSSFSLVSGFAFIATRIYDEYSAGPSIRSICTRCCLTMTNMIQVCSKFH